MRRFINVIRSILGVSETRPLDDDLWSLEGNRIRVKLSQLSELCPKGGGVYLRGRGLRHPILIVRTEGEQYLAFTNRCPHSFVVNRKLDPVPDQNILRCCGVSHSTFDFEGNRLSGPARDALTCHRTEFSEDHLMIYLNRI
jgi:nitrite reductase/ring-hydroxylating ferredoxin subunit